MWGTARRTVMWLHVEMANLTNFSSTGKIEGTNNENRATGETGVSLLTSGSEYYLHRNGQPSFPAYSALIALPKEIHLYRSIQKMGLAESSINRLA